MAGKHFRVRVDGKTGEATDVIPIGFNEETDIGRVFAGPCYHLVLARNAEMARGAAEQDHADSKDVCPPYPTRTKAVDVVE